MLCLHTWAQAHKNFALQCQGHWREFKGHERCPLPVEHVSRETGQLKGMPFRDSCSHWHYPDGLCVQDSRREGFAGCVGKIRVDLRGRGDGHAGWVGVA